jgi:HAD superfamily hydrolase (TIGR01509 family)
VTTAVGTGRPTPGDENLAAVLFDMDGTLIDSEPLWWVAMDRVAQRLGGTLSAGVMESTTGLSIPVSVALLLADIGSDRDPVSTEALLLEVTGELFAEELRWQPGAEELIDEIRSAGLRTALVTNSPRSVVQVALGLLGGHRFDVTVAGDEVAAEKPDPEPYLSAMRGLGLTGAQCLAVEDSPSGTQAAVAAGIGVLVVSAGVDVPDGPGRIFASTLLGATVDELRHIHHEFRRSLHRLDAQ